MQMAKLTMEVLPALPGNTYVFCGHEYTLENAKFGSWIEPANTACQALVGVSFMYACGVTVAVVTRALGAAFSSWRKPKRRRLTTFQPFLRRLMRKQHTTHSCAWTTRWFEPYVAAAEGCWRPSCVVVISTGFHRRLTRVLCHHLRKREPTRRTRKARWRRCSAA